MAQVNATVIQLEFADVVSIVASPSSTGGGASTFTTVERISLPEPDSAASDSDATTSGATGS